MTLTINQFYIELKVFLNQHQIPYKDFDMANIDFSKSDIDIVLKSEADLKKIKAFIRKQSIKIKIRIDNKKQFYFIIIDKKNIHAFDFMVGLLASSGLISNGNYLFQSSDEGINFIKNYQFLKRKAKSKENFYIIKEVKYTNFLKLLFYSKKIVINIKNLFKSKDSGLYVALLGADGSGKSTALNYIKEQFSEKRKLFPLKRIYFKPNVFKIKPDNKNSLKSGHLPHSSPSYSSILSLAKVIYIFLNYLLYIPILSIRKKNGHLILFDRHFYDLLIDAQRHRIDRTGVWLASLLVNFIPKPDILIILSAETEQLSQRKPDEVNKDLLNSLNSRYKNFKPKKVSTYHLINNRSLESLHEQLTSILIGNMVK